LLPLSSLQTLSLSFPLTIPLSSLLLIQSSPSLSDSSPKSSLLSLVSYSRFPFRQFLSIWYRV
ncbi:hypothetical protein GIB67_006860, partial [Kingdonia uniflora]